MGVDPRIPFYGERGGGSKSFVEEFPFFPGEGGGESWPAGKRKAASDADGAGKRCGDPTRKARGFASFSNLLVRPKGGSLCLGRPPLSGKGTSERAPSKGPFLLGPSHRGGSDKRESRESFSPKILLQEGPRKGRGRPP